jgi:hypothetical protein
MFVSHFEEPSPFPGLTEGLLYHGLCTLLSYLNQLDGLSEDVRKTSLQVAGPFAAFAHREKHWKALGQA